MKVVVLLLGIVYVTSALDCSIGQSEWCSSLRAAKKCGAVNHCKDTVWKNAVLREDESDVCDFCKSMVGDVQKMLVDKKTQEEIQSSLKGLCALVPDSSMQEECNKAITEDLPELLMLLSEELDPSLVCSTLGLCQTNDVFEMLVNKEPKPQPIATTGDICVDCKAFFGDIKAEVTSKTTEQELIQMIESSFCANLGPLEETCDNLVAQYVPELLQMIADDYDPALDCSLLGFCTSSAESKLLLPQLRLAKSPLYLAAQGDDQYCNDCKQVFQLAETYLSNQEIEGIITQLLTQLCNEMKDYKQVCIQTIDQYLPEILKMLVSDIDPAKDCQMIGLCSATQEEFPLIDMQPADLVITHDDMVAMQQTGPKMTSSVDASVQCILCEFVVDKLDSLLTENATEADILAALDKVCSILPSSISQECNDFVNTYGPAVLAILSQEMRPAIVCSTLGLCGSSQTKNLVTLNDDQGCEICKLVIQYVDSLLQPNATEKDIEQALDKICNFLPDTFKSQCDTFVAAYAPTITKLILKEMTPSLICSEIKLCQSRQTKPLLGASECTWGPGYWCASEENAEKCNAKEHCKKHVWN